MDQVKAREASHIAGKIQRSPPNRRGWFFVSRNRRSSKARSWQNADSAILAAILLLIVSLCYKLAVLGAMVMIALGLAIWVLRTRIRRFDLVFLLGLAYVADATVTSFLVSYSAGVERTIQFCIVAASLIGLYAYAQSATRQNAEFLLKGVAALCVVILAHLIIWHLLNGHPVTWKYLSDTKLILSLSLIPFFALEDRIKERGRFIFPASILMMFAIILLSGERKALMLFCILFALSRFSIAVKASLVGGIVAVAGVALLVDGGYIERQLTSASHDYSQTPVRYFFSVQSIYDHSDIIREFVNRNAWHLFQQHQQVGIGATGYWAWALRTYGNRDGFAMNVHGELDRVPVEGGLLGIGIALLFLVLSFWRAGRHVISNGGFAAPALDRTPLYCVILMFCYCYAEAMNTAMLLLIGAVGLITGSLPVPSTVLRRARTGFNRLTDRTRNLGRPLTCAGSLRRPV